MAENQEQIRVWNMWMAALRSGEYKKGQNQLRTDRDCHGIDYDTPKYCCLGVVCELARKDGGDEWDVSFRRSDGFLPQPMSDFLGLTNDMLSEIAIRNDADRYTVHADFRHRIRQKYTFKQMADWLERKVMPEALATDSGQPANPQWED